MFPSRTNKSGYKNMQNGTETFTCFAILKNILFIYFLIIVLAVPYLCCCMRAFPSCGEWGGYSSLWCMGFSLRQPLPLCSVGCRAHRRQYLQHMGSVVEVPGLQSTGLTAMARGFSYFSVCRSFLHQASNPCPLRWRTDS